MNAKRKFKLEDVYTIFLAILTLEQSNKVLPFKLAWALSDIKDGLKKHAIRFETEKASMLEKFGTKVENSSSYTFSEENSKAFGEAISVLQAVEVTVEIPYLTLEMLNSAASLDIPSGVLPVIKTHLLKPTPEVKSPENKSKVVPLNPKKAAKKR